MNDDLPHWLKPKLTQERLNELLHYDPETGVFHWKHSKGRARAGQKAGNLSVNGYIEIRIDGVLHYAHRLTWLYVHGRLPELQIDHIDGNRANNKLINLREATNTQNHYNKGRPRNNTSGVKGVCWDTSRHRWVAQIVSDGKRKFLGRFEFIEDAVKAVETTRDNLHKDFARHG